MPLRLKRTWEIMTGQREPVTAGDAEGADRGQGNNADTSYPQAPDADGVDVSLRITGWKRTGVAIRTADELVLEREPDNIYDPFAVRFITQERKHAGYVMAGQAALLAPALDAGDVELLSRARVIEESTDGKARPLEVKVTIVHHGRAIRDTSDSRTV